MGALLPRFHQGWRSIKTKLPKPLRTAIAKAEFKTVKTVYAVFYRNRRKKMLGAALPKAWKSNHDYEQYLAEQIHRSDRHSMRWVPGVSEGLPERTVQLVALMDKSIPKKDRKGTVLCIGCRSAHELDYITSKLGMPAKGLDLFSDDPRIVIGDMHKIPFKPKTFTVLYSCHSLEHAYDSKAAAAEFTRVTKPGGFIVIEVPVQYKLSSTDRWDFKSPKKVVALFGKRVKKILYKDTTMCGSEKSARVIMQLR